MSFPIEKILTVSARDYLEFCCPPTTRKNYEMFGVYGGSIQKMAEKVPEHAEVVTDLILLRNSGFYGTALVPKSSEYPTFSQEER